MQNQELIFLKTKHAQCILENSRSKNPELERHIKDLEKQISELENPKEETPKKHSHAS